MKGIFKVVCEDVTLNTFEDWLDARVFVDEYTRIFILLAQHQMIEKNILERLLKTTITVEEVYNNDNTKTND